MNRKMIESILDALDGVLDESIVEGKLGKKKPGLMAVEIEAGKAPEACGCEREEAEEAEKAPETCEHCGKPMEAAAAELPEGAEPEEDEDDLLDRKFARISRGKTAFAGGE